MFATDLNRKFSLKRQNTEENTGFVVLLNISFILFLQILH